MDDPVTIRNCGHTFEKAAIVQHIEYALQNSARPSCPTCRGKADAADLVPNFTVKGQIDRLKNGQDSSFVERPRSPSRTTGGPAFTPVTLSSIYKQGFVVVVAIVVLVGFAGMKSAGIGQIRMLAFDVMSFVCTCAKHIALDFTDESTTLREPPTPNWCLAVFTVLQAGLALIVPFQHRFFADRLFGGISGKKWSLSSFGSVVGVLCALAIMPITIYSCCRFAYMSTRYVARLASLLAALAGYGLITTYEKTLSYSDASSVPRGVKHYVYRAGSKLLGIWMVAVVLSMAHSWSFVEHNDISTYGADKVKWWVEAHTSNSDVGVAIAHQLRSKNIVGSSLLQMDEDGFASAGVNISHFASNFAHLELGTQALEHTVASMMEALHPRADEPFASFTFWQYRLMERQKFHKVIALLTSAPLCGVWTLQTEWPASAKPTVNMTWFDIVVPEYYVWKNNDAILGGLPDGIQSILALRNFGRLCSLIIGVRKGEGLTTMSKLIMTDFGVALFTIFDNAVLFPITPWFLTDFGFWLGIYVLAPVAGALFVCVIQFGANDLDEGNRRIWQGD